MRRLLALAAATAAVFVSAPAEASSTICTPTARVGVCVDNICVHICGPEVEPDLYCRISHVVCTGIEDL